MVSALDPRAVGPGLSTSRDHCLVFSGKTLTLTVPLSTQEYKYKILWVTSDGLASHPGEIAILLVSL